MLLFWQMWLLMILVTDLEIFHYRLHSPLIAVGSDDPSSSSGGKVFIYEFSNNTRKWTRVETLVTVTEPVHDIAFAPNLGRSYHLLGIATKDVKIIALKPNK